MSAISVIIPVYQSRAYLSSCLDSVLNQDFDLPYQVVLVETGSDDGSDEICERYQKEYPEIVFHFHYDRPYSISMARNLGILHSNGQYVLFVDGDDMLEKNALSVLYAQAKDDAEVIAASHAELYGDQEKMIPNLLLGKKSGRDALHALFHHSTFFGYCWNHLISRNFLLKNHIYFESYVSVYEDLLFMMEVYYRADNVLFLKEQTYLYRQREGSTLSSCNDLLSCHIGVLSILKKKLRYDPVTRKELFSHCSHGLKKQFAADRKRSGNPNLYKDEIHRLFGREKG